MNPTKQAESFVTALLLHAPVQITIIRRIGTDREQSLHKPHAVASLDDLRRLLGWLRHENATRDANIYARPDPAQQHPWLFLDDLPTSKALAVARKYGALVVETSAGNAQVRLLADAPLTTGERTVIQRQIAALIGSDAGSIAGDKWGRLPGFTNRKLGKAGQWTNMLDDTTSAAPAFSPEPIVAADLNPRPAELKNRRGRGRVVSSAGCGDMSAREFKYACHALRAGVAPSVVEQRIAEHVAATGRRKSNHYPASTVAAALSSVR